VQGSEVGFHFPFRRAGVTCEQMLEQPPPGAGDHPVGGRTHRVHQLAGESGPAAGILRCPVTGDFGQQAEDLGAAALLSQPGLVGRLAAYATLSRSIPRAGAVIFSQAIRIRTAIAGIQISSADRESGSSITRSFTGIAVVR
jgi:hypothetical protein